MFFVVDGQHRILALEKLIEDDNGEGKWRDFMIPFVCMIGADENEEMDQFYIVNSKAKSVRTDLAYALLKERADRNGEVMEALVERGREWQVEGQTLVERIAETSPVWRHRIRFPAMNKDDTTISNTSLVNSLKPLVNDSPLFKRASVEQRLKILDAYWQGIRSCMREAFDDPTNFSIQKGIGVIVMHEILPDVIELIRSQGGSLVDPDSYHLILEPMLDALEGDSGLGEPVKGTDFWRASVSGAAGSFSSSAGRRVLIAKTRQLLPDVSVE
jgi:DGQHR domain-containing protein